MFLGCLSVCQSDLHRGSRWTSGLMFLGLMWHYHCNEYSQLNITVESNRIIVPVWFNSNRHTRSVPIEYVMCWHPASLLWSITLPVHQIFKLPLPPRLKTKNWRTWKAWVPLTYITAGWEGMATPLSNGPRTTGLRRETWNTGEICKWEGSFNL